MSYAGEEFDQRAAELLCPADYQNPEPQSKYHLVVIGAGPAGLICAIGAAGLGARVALVERNRMGGDCLNVGCVPSKALLEFTAAEVDADFDRAFRWLREVRAGIAPHDSVERYREAGVDVFLGRAELTADADVQVGNVLLHTRRVAVCTGAVADIPPIPGLRESSPLTNETVFDLRHKPASLAILGAGAIGCEMALVFARLGVTVHLFELAEQVLPLEIEEAGAAVASALAAAGVNIHTGQAVARVSRRDEGCQVEAGGKVYQADEVLVALGRRPNTGTLNLQAAGVEVDERGFIRTDNRLRTRHKKVYAAGDCTSLLQFTHLADAQARAVVQNTLFAPTARVDELVVPHCTYTNPEVASVGATAASLQAAGQGFDEYRFDFGDLDRGRAEIDGQGFAVVYTRKGSDRILGATVVGHDAGEQIAPVCLLMSNGLGLSAAGKALYAYPTRAEYLKRLADAYNRTRLTPLVSRLFALWLKMRG